MKEILMAAAMALCVSVPQSAMQSASAQPVQQATPPQQAIPDAPKPQTTGIGPVAPGKGTTPASNGAPATAASPDDPFQKPVTDKLPSSPADQDVDVAPDLPSTPVGGEALPDVLRLYVNYVEVPFTVKDSKGRLVPGLTWRDVRIYENNVRQHIVRFVADPIPLSMAVVVDQSLPFQVENKVNTALGALQSAFAAYDDVALFTYNNGPKLITDFTAGQSARLGGAIELAKTPGRENLYYAPGEALGGTTGIQINNHADDHINPLTSGGPGSPSGVRTNQVPRDVHTLNDAILEAAKATTKAGKGRRRVVYVISDGKEYGSIAKTKEVIKYLLTNKIEVYATLVGDSSVAGMGFLDHIHLPLTVRDNILPVYTNATGGQTYAEFSQRAISASFAHITEAVRTQYLIGYNSREPFIDSKFRKTEVKVLRPNLTVIAKEGYYPTPADTLIRPPALQPASQQVPPKP